MPTKKRAKKKTAQKKPAPHKKTPAKSKKRESSWLKRVCVCIIFALLLISGIYYFGSFETRSSMERALLSTLQSPRTHGATPAPVARVLDTLHDAIPNSEGLVVEGGELGRDQTSPFLAGMPHSRQSLRPLIQESYIQLFNEKRQQPACIALRLDDSPRKEVLTTGQTQFDLPMSASFAAGPWQKAMHALTIRYPTRFGEVWLYLGPVYNPKGSELATGTPIPDAYYAIVLDLTDTGGLRALALLMPAEAESKNLNDYITSIAQIEKLTGMQFLPELDFSVRDTLGNYVSPSVW